mgnify:CR=1 FL=1
MQLYIFCALSWSHTYHLGRLLIDDVDSGVCGVVAVSSIKTAFSVILLCYLSKEHGRWGKGFKLGKNESHHSPQVIRLKTYNPMNICEYIAV